MVRKRKPPDGDEPSTPVPEDPDASAPGSTLAHVRRAKDSADDPSWHNVVEKVQSFIRREFGDARLPSGCTIDDLISDSLTRLYQSLSRYEEREATSFWSWMRTVVRHALIDLKRKEELQPGSLESLAGSGSALPIPDPGASTPGAVREQEIHDALMQCLAQLDARKAKVLELRLLLSLSYEEIAQRLGFNRAVTVRTIVRRGRQELERCMRAKGFGESISL